MSQTSNDLNISQPGYVVFDGTSSFSGRTFQAGSNIVITNASGVAGNTIISAANLSGITEVDAGLGISVQTVGTVVTVTNTGIVTYTSPLINFKNTGVTTIFTSLAAKPFYCIFFTEVWQSSTAPNLDAVFNLGWTAANYDDFVSANNFIAPANNIFIDQTAQRPIIPANTTFKINVTGADSGTALTGYIVLQGFYL